MSRVAHLHGWPVEIVPSFDGPRHVALDPDLLRASAEGNTWFVVVDGVIVSELTHSQILFVDREAWDRAERPS